MAEDITSKRQEIIDASVAAFKSLIINKYNNQTLSNITVASKKWWSTAGNNYSVIWACCDADTAYETGYSLIQSTYSITKNTYWNTYSNGILPTIGYGSPLYYNSVRYVLYAGKLTRSSRLDDNGNIVIEYDAVWDMGVSRLLADGTYDMREDNPNTAQQTGGWKVPIPNSFYSSWIRPDANCWDGACNSIEDTEKPCGVLCSSLQPVEKTDPVYCTPAFEESYTIGNFTMDPVVAPDVPVDPDIPVDPDDPDDPDNPGDYTYIDYLTLDTYQVILTNEQIQAVPSKVVCEFAVDFGETTDYSPYMFYPIMACPVTYLENECSSETVFNYSSPQSINVDLFYDNSDLRNTILRVDGPEACRYWGDEVNTHKALLDDHVVEVDLQLSAGSSKVRFDDYDLTLDSLDGVLNRVYDQPLAIAIGGYFCGKEGSVQYHCVGKRKIYGVRIEGVSSDDTVELLPVKDSTEREGLLNTKTGRIVYPMSAADEGGYYNIDYIILNSNIGIELDAQVGSSSILTVTFKVPEESSQGKIPLMSIPGTVGGKDTTIELVIDTFLTEDDTLMRLLEPTLFNVDHPAGVVLGNVVLPLDTDLHTIDVNFTEGKVFLDGEEKSNIIEHLPDASAVQWDHPSTDEYPIAIGTAPSLSSSVGGYNYIAIKEVQVRKAYRRFILPSTGLATTLERRYYFPVMTYDYVACLNSSMSRNSSWGLDPCYAMYSVPGYSIHSAGLYKLPGMSS